jgi:hypothetical protein
MVTVVADHAHEDASSIVSDATLLYFDIRTMQMSDDLRLDNVQHGLLIPGSSREKRDSCFHPMRFGSHGTQRYAFRSVNKHGVSKLRRLAP